jgi:hypothetical protein
MKILDRHKPIISEFWKQLEDGAYDEKYSSGFLFFEESFKDLILEDIGLTEHLSIYPYIIFALWKEGYKVDELEDDYKKLEFFLENRTNLKLSSSTDYMDLKVFSNSFYANLANPYKKYNYNERNKGIWIAQLVCFYNSLILNDLRVFNENKIIYIDVDSIYHIGDLDYKDLNFIKRDFMDIDFLCIERKKRYMLLSEGEYKSKGYRRISKSEVENKFKSVVRDRQLRKLGI